MKNLLLFVILSFSLIQCSKDDSDSTAESVVYKYENSEVTINSWTAYKNGDRFVITAVGESQSFAIEFNKYGNLASANSYSNAINGIPFSKSFAYYSSYFLDFNLINIDADNQIVNFNFNGHLHENDYDVASTTHSVEGDFNVKYIELAETELSRLNCKIDNQDWRATSGSITGSNFDYLKLYNYSDDQHTIEVNFNINTIAVCTDCAFNNVSELSMGLAIYDPTTDDLIQFDVSGIITISEYVPVAGLSYGSVEGSFSFVAIHPTTGATVTVNDGTFKQFFN